MRERYVLESMKYKQ